MDNIPLSSRGLRGANNLRNAQRCLALTKKGSLCLKPAEYNAQTGLKKRCSLHGSKSTGPRSAEGKARVGAAAFRHGRFTKSALEQRRVLREKLRQLRGELKRLANGYQM
jgi:ribosomal protein L19E